ncbi:hypothetical protein PAXRUDRAFT_499036 [Paxillus rubicundulus Ve08.2h10]|uniref:Uncharacterized protein n=1 Tax=Paxillus rubicundulus Ve08.2h10 TaxID=930991 RepID=A0A0D0CJ93_9AGAM|nr:hypothetical protein PAXRUDRAFT_499036 [Paxillus rubicundulus Ve08.2h10]
MSRPRVFILLPTPTSKSVTKLQKSKTYSSACSVSRCAACHAILDQYRHPVAGAIDFPLHNRYLPWSTLERDLQKHGYEITNWPPGIPRENDKGINTLSAGHVHKLYVALTQCREEDRPQFVRRLDQSIGMSTIKCRSCSSFIRHTDQNEGVTQVRNMANSKRGLDIDHYDGKGKRARFKVTTAEHYAGHST